MCSLSPHGATVVHMFMRRWLPVFKGCPMRRIKGWGMGYLCISWCLAPCRADFLRKPVIYSSGLDEMLRYYIRGRDGNRKAPIWEPVPNCLIHRNRVPPSASASMFSWHATRNSRNAVCLTLYASVTASQPSSTSLNMDKYPVLE